MCIRDSAWCPGSSMAYRRASIPPHIQAAVSRSLVERRPAIHHLKEKSMDIKRIGRNPAGGDQSRSRASQISVHNGTAYFAATPDRPFDPGASITVQTQQLLKRVDERLAL